MLKFKEKIGISVINGKHFLYSTDGGEVLRYDRQDAPRILARLIDAHSYYKMRVECEWERDDYRKYHLPPPPPEHEFETSESCSLLIILRNESRFNKETFQSLPAMFLKMLPEGVMEHLLATDKQRNYMKELGIKNAYKYKYLTRNEASWYISNALEHLKEREMMLSEGPSVLFDQPADF